MKGMVFTELIEYVESELGFDVADAMIENAALQNGGAFTQAGNYPFDDLERMVASLSRATGLPAEKLLYIFGNHLFDRLIQLYPGGMQAHATPLDFIADVDAMVHVEVRKLYPDAELPRFTVLEKSSTHLTLVYESEKRLEPFAHGLIDGCARRYDMAVETAFRTIGESPHRALFELKMAP